MRQSYVWSGVGRYRDSEVQLDGIATSKVEQANLFFCLWPIYFYLCREHCFPLWPCGQCCFPPGFMEDIAPLLSSTLGFVHPLSFGVVASPSGPRPLFICIVCVRSHTLKGGSVMSAPKSVPYYASGLCFPECTTNVATMEYNTQAPQTLMRFLITNTCSTFLTAHSRQEVSVHTYTFARCLFSVGFMTVLSLLFCIQSLKCPDQNSCFLMIALL